MSLSPQPPRRAGALTTGRGLLVAGVVVLMVAAGVTWWQTHRSGPSHFTMTYGSVTKTEPAGSRTTLTVDYTGGGTRHTTTGAVTSADFTAEGKVVWVCYRTGDPGSARLRLPTDPLCNQR